VDIPSTHIVFIDHSLDAFGFCAAMTRCFPNREPEMSDRWMSCHFFPKPINLATTKQSKSFDTAKTLKLETRSGFRGINLISTDVALIFVEQLARARNHNLIRTSPS
jgi:hypothetical protein